MFKRVAYIFLFLSLLFLTISCSKYQKLLKNSDHEQKYEVAINYFEQKDYFRALSLFEQVIAAYRGTSKVEEIYYYYAYCYYYQKDYLVASYYFKRYAKNFPNNPRAEECLFISAYCYYLDSPKYSLDQTNTYEAIKELQLFINFFPDSERIETCNKLIDELRGKLEKKDFEIAKLYLKTGHYKAAITAFNNILRDYPDTPNKEDILYYIIKSYFNYAIYSVKDKQEERYQAAIEAYNDFIYLFPESEFTRDASNMHNNAWKQISKE